MTDAIIHPYSRLRKINVTDKIEKKMNLSYLSWAFAVDLLLQEDPSATWEYKDTIMYGRTLMVFCSVHAFGKTMTAQLPVMDHKNKAIVDPDAFSVNTAMQRCLAKAIALHGIGLYIYQGEDVPKDDFNPDPNLKPIPTTDQIRAMKKFISEGKKDDVLKAFEKYKMSDELKANILGE